MNQRTRTALDNILSENPDTQNESFHYLIEETRKPVDWAYDAWEELVKMLRHKDNHVRAIASQVLCNLAKSDPEARMISTLDALLATTKDERFVTARHCMQSLWAVGVAGKDQQQKLVDGLERRFDECSAEKNCTLIRFDIIQGLRKVYDEVRDETIKQRALALIEAEPDIKYRKKYASVWKKT